jgi:hypothetical protein
MPSHFELTWLQAEAGRTSPLHSKPYLKKNKYLTWSFLPTFGPGLPTIGILKNV